MLWNQRAIRLDPAKILEIKELDPKILINKNLRRYSYPFWERYSQCGIEYSFQAADRKAVAKLKDRAPRLWCIALFLEYQFWGSN